MVASAYKAILKIMPGYFAAVTTAVRACYDGVASEVLLSPAISYFTTTAMNQTSVKTEREAGCGCIDPIATADHGCICLVSELVQVIGRKYSLRLLMLIGNQPSLRFSVIRSEMDELSSSTLTIRLTELEHAGLIQRREFAEIPPRVEYSLTPAGIELRQRLFSLSRFAARQKAL